MIGSTGNRKAQRMAPCLDVATCGNPEVKAGSTVMGQSGTQNWIDHRNPEVLPGGGDPGGVDPVEEAKVGGRWCLEKV